MRSKVNPMKLIVYTIILVILDQAAHASTFLKCSSRDIKTCTMEVTKGEAIVMQAKDPSVIIVKLDFVKLDLEKGTLRNNNK